MKHLAAVISLVPFLAVAACSKAPRSDALTAEDLHIAQQAMPVSEALLMIRAGYKESQIIGDLKKRHIPGPIDANTEDQFLKAGASPALISALNSKENALTENQRGAYQKYQAEKSNRVTQSAQTRRNEDFIRQQEEQQELYRRRSLQQQTLQNINRSQSAQVSYEVAQRNYETQRKSLEQQITSLEASVNWKRSHGYRESELAVANQSLEDYRKQLRDLTPPLR